MSRYDEDLYENPFFNCLEKHSGLFDKATSNRWIVCVPKFSAIPLAGEITVGDLEDHVLVPQAGSDHTYKTVSNKTVDIKQGNIVLGAGFKHGKQVPVLFEETFYNTTDESYRVLCVASVFNRDQTADAVSEVSMETDIYKPPVSYNDCLRLLWGQAGSVKTKESLDKSMLMFCSAYQKFEGGTVTSLADFVASHLTRAMQIVLKDQAIKRSVKHSDQYMASLKIAVEMYMMNAVHKHLFSVITEYESSADAIINKRTRNLLDVRLHHLGVRREFEDNLPQARKELAMMNQFSTPLGRLLCLKRVVTALTKPLKQVDDLVMTTDDFLPLLIYLIIKSQIPNWSANLMYMKYCQQAKVSDDDEFSFYLATTEAALNYIKSGNIKLDNSPSPSHKPAAKPVVSSDGTSLKRQGSTGASSAKDKFFQYVQFGDETAVKLMLKKPTVTNSNDMLSQLCHPLCDCDKCTDVVASSQQPTSGVSTQSRDDMGHTALHLAALYGRANLIDILAKGGVLIDASDYLGCTPLHLACQKGHQNIILLLVHFGADISAVDNEGNTPLHMCAKNGHEDCVKAILFLDILKSRLDVNAKNDLGDTALHLAAKWGYVGIVKFLLDTEADPRVRNRKRQTPLDCTQNAAIKRELQAAFNDPPPTVYRHPTQKSSPPPAHPPPTITAPSVSKPTPPHTLATQSDDNTPVEGKNPLGFEVVDIRPSRPPVPVQLIDNSSSEMMSPKTPEVASLDQADMHQKDRLIKAIAKQDIQLVKFYLGWVDTPELDDDDSPISPGADHLCHPLCQCAKCQPLQKSSMSGSLHVNCQNKKGFAPLHIAVIENSMDCFELFLRKGANVNIQTCKHITPLHLACYHNNMEMVKQLLKHGADVNVRDDHGEQPIHLACAKKNTDVVAYLLQHGSAASVASISGNTPLHHAAEKNSIDIVRILLDHGADPSMTNCEGLSPYNLTKDVEIQHRLFQRRAQEVKERTSSLSRLKSAAASTEQSADDMKPEPDSAPNRYLSLTLDERQLKKVKELGSSIQMFDKHSTLKKSKTFDQSAPLLNSPDLKLSLSIKHFDKGKSLRHSETFDRSEPKLSTFKHSLTIQHFDFGSLKHVESIDKSSPMHIYSLTRSLSNYDDYSDGLSVEEIVRNDDIGDDIQEVLEGDEETDYKSDVKDEEAINANTEDSDATGMNENESDIVRDVTGDDVVGPKEEITDLEVASQVEVNDKCSSEGTRKAIDDNQTSDSRMTDDDVAGGRSGIVDTGKSDVSIDRADQETSIAMEQGKSLVSEDTNVPVTGNERVDAETSLIKEELGAVSEHTNVPETGIDGVDAETSDVKEEVGAVGEVKCVPVTNSEHSDTVQSDPTVMNEAGNTVGNTIASGNETMHDTQSCPDKDDTNTCSSLPNTNCDKTVSEITDTVTDATNGSLKSDSCVDT